MNKGKFNIKPEYNEEFLLSEFQTAWSMLETIDNRRGIYFNYYTVAFFSVIAFLANLLNNTQQGLFTPTASFLICTSFIFAGHKIISALKSENEASVRYRNKINIIREIFLIKIPKNNKIKKTKINQFYIENSDLTGIKIFSKKKICKKKIGNTLKSLINIIHLEQGLSAAFALFSLYRICVQIHAN